MNIIILYHNIVNKNFIFKVKLILIVKDKNNHIVNFKCKHTYTHRIEEGRTIANIL